MHLIIFRNVFNNYYLLFNNKLDIKLLIRSYVNVFCRDRIIYVNILEQEGRIRTLILTNKNKIK